MYAASGMNQQAAATPDYLERLNPQQRAAVEDLDGPLLVLAGAGTGKTRVLTTRLAHLVATRRAFPSQILAVTFTNKAAREMRERIAAMIGPVAEGLWLGTFHALSARFLRRHAELVGLRPDFAILDSDDQTPRHDPGVQMRLVLLQSLAALCQGVYRADLIAILASIDPVLGDVDR